jgi:hypothetical protein
VSAIELPCAELSESLGEDMSGTAPAERLILVVEQPGPWGRDAVSESGLRPIAKELQARADEAGARIQVVRRSTRRYRPDHYAAWVADVHARTMARYELRDIREVLDLPLEASEPAGEPLELCCTHSTRDACCARRGLPLHRSLARAGADVWHASHLGGHRFAATMAVLPHGLWLGRVPVARARDVMAAVRADRIPLEYTRGRAGWPPIAQAAELAVRRADGLDGLDDVRVVEVDGEVVRLGGAGEWTVRMRWEPTEAVRALSCGAGAKMEDPGRWIVEDYARHG